MAIEFWALMDNFLSSNEANGLTHFMPQVSFYVYPLKISESRFFVFELHRKQQVSWNGLSPVVIGKQKQVVGLVVPEEFTWIKKKQHLAHILYQELVKEKEKYSNRFELNKIAFREKNYSIFDSGACIFAVILVCFLLVSNKCSNLLRQVQHFIPGWCIFKSSIEKYWIIFLKNYRRGNKDFLVKMGGSPYTGVVYRRGDISTAFH